jgi:hypothetical protein
MTTPIFVPFLFAALWFMISGKMKKIASGKNGLPPRLPPLRLIKDKWKSIEIGRQRMDEASQTLETAENFEEFKDLIRRFIKSKQTHSKGRPSQTTD